MAQDPKDAKVTARVFFEGIMLMCLNPDKHCEVGIIPCSKHESRITIEPRGPDIKVGFKKFYDITHDLYIQVVKPEDPRVKLHEEGSVRDFSHLPDLEGPRLHGAKVDVRTVDLLARLAINAGELYAHELSGDVYNLMTWIDIEAKGTRVRTWGRLVDDLCLNIICRDEADSGIQIFNAVSGGKIEWLPRLPEPNYYEMKIENDCGPPSSDREPSDFRFYYDVVTAKDTLKYDFAQPPGAPSPHVCESAFLSQTTSLGLKFRP